MHLLTFSVGGTRRLGALVDGSVLDLEQASRAYLTRAGRSSDLTLPADMLAFLDRGDEAAEIARATIEHWRKILSQPGGDVWEGVRFDLSSVRVCAPIPRPRKDIVCLAGNYNAHVQESIDPSTGRPRPYMRSDPRERKAAVFFGKPPTAVVGPGDAVEWDETVTQKVDYEGELAVVIGQKGKNITPERAYEHVFGYTIMNDISARDLQRLHEQFYRGKGLDTFAPLGPYLVGKGEIPNPHNLQLTTTVNGELRQQANTGEMTRLIPELIAIWSAGITLEPGDIIATGTCSGVGQHRQPPLFLKDGDIVEVTIEGIGTLSNRMRCLKRNRAKPEEVSP